MLCQRCGGLIVVANMRYLMEREFHSEVATTRCINCGNFEDSVIRSNRNTSACTLTEHSPNATPQLSVASHSTDARTHEEAHIVLFPQPNQTLRRGT